MKRLFLFLASACLLGFTQAQITLDSSSVGQPGSVYIVAQDTVLPVGYNLGTPGTNLTWDFSQLNQDVYDTVTYADPDNTPFGADYPSANLCISRGSNGMGYAYFEKTAATFSLLGFAADPFMSGNPFIIRQTPPSLSGIFPWTYQSSLSDTSTFSVRIDGTFLGVAGVDSVEFISTTEREVVCDSWGDLILWGNTYSALRNKEVRNTRDLTNVRFFGFWTNFQDTSYTDSSFIWLNNTKGYTLAQADYQGGVLVRIEYQDANPVAMDAGLAGEVVVYPNPAHDRVTIQSSLDEIATVRLFSLNGKLLREVEMNLQRAELNLQGLAPGIYLLQGLDMNQGTRMQRKLVVR
jgi:hypothetical protein